MTFDVTFLGTAASMPSTERGLPALVVQHERQRFLVDCGEGTQRQLMHSGLGFRRLDRVLLTHGHLDHILGLAGFASSLALLDAAERLSIHGGRHALGLVRRLLLDVVWPGGRPPLDLDFVELAPGVVLEEPGLRVTAFPVRHRAPDCFGFVFEEPARRPLREDRLAALKVPEGPERRRLADGGTVVLEDGRRVAPDEVLGDPLPGVRLAVVGDTESVADLIEPVRGADVLVIEATFLDADRDMARRRSHITAAEAAWLAREAGVGALYLTHLSSRYRVEEIVAEAGAIFADTYAARDFARIAVKRPARRG